MRNSNWKFSTNLRRLKYSCANLSDNETNKNGGEKIESIRILENNRKIYINANDS